MSKMTVIQLLNKIANEEEVPRKIKWGEFELEWEELGYHDYKFLGTGNHLLFQGFTTSVLNDEVEVIGEKEKDRKIEKICTFPGLDDYDYAYEDGNRPNNVKINNKMEELLIDKINEIIDYINGGANGE